MLEKLLRSKAEVKILGVVLFEDGLHLREIARRAGVSPFEARRELGNLVELGFLTTERRGNQALFRTDPKCPFRNDLKNLYQKTEGVFSGLREAFSHGSGITYAFVFGSAAHGRERRFSDVDVMAIGKVDEEELSRRILAVQGKTGKEINYIVWTLRDLEEKADKRSSFLNSIVKNRKVWLCGDENEFIRIAEQRTGKKGRARRA